jgi:hypothetical protein
MDTGFNSEANRRVLQGAGDAFIIGEKMRSGPKDGSCTRPLKRPGATRPSLGLRFKEVIVGKGSVAARRFVIVHNPEEAEARRAQARRHRARDRQRRLAKLGDLTGKAHTRPPAPCGRTPPSAATCGRPRAGSWRSTKGKIAREAKLDGKYLISTSDDYLSAEDVASATSSCTRSNASTAT